MKVIPATTAHTRDPLEFVTAHRAELLSYLPAHGAVLLTGFDVDGPAMFERTLRVIAPSLMRENGEHEPITGTEHVYTPVEYDRTRTLLWHNENSFDRSWPLIISFCCTRTATIGGETTVATSRQLMQRLTPRLVEEFRRKGVRYVRRMGLGVGRTWQQVFRTQDPSIAEARCRAAHLDCTWLEEGALQTSCVRPATVRHPSSGEECWFHQAQHWHPCCLDPVTRAGLLDAFGSGRLPRDCSFGDGSPIGDDLMAEILDAYGAVETAVTWRCGDIMLVDNIAAAHGRRPYQGIRELLVAMGEPHTFSPGAHGAAAQTVKELPGQRTV